MNFSCKNREHIVNIFLTNFEIDCYDYWHMVH